MLKDNSPIESGIGLGDTGRKPNEALDSGHIVDLKN